MRDRPIDVYDVAGIRQDATPPAPVHPAMGDHWYWCRHHKRAEHVGWAMDGCVRVGPFMSKAEAEILRRDHLSFVTAAGGQVHYERPPAPLGMEIEQ